MGRLKRIVRDPPEPAIRIRTRVPAWSPRACARKIAAGEIAVSLAPTGAGRYGAGMAAFRVAFVQARPRFGARERNLEHGLSLARSVDADLVVLPELWASGYVFSSHREVAELAEDARRGPTARALAAAARRERRHYVAGFGEWW